MDMEVSEGAAIKSGRQEKIDENKNPVPKEGNRTFLDKLLGRNKAAVQPTPTAGSVPPELEQSAPLQQPQETASVLFNNDGTPKNNVIPHPDIDKKFPPNPKYDPKTAPKNVIPIPPENQLPEYLRGNPNPQLNTPDNVVPFRNAASDAPETIPQSGPEDPTVA